HRREIRGLRADEHDVRVQPAMDGDGAGEERVLEAELHEDEQHCERHAREGDREPQLFAPELQPGQAGGGDHPAGSIATSTCRLVRAAARWASSRRIFTSTTRASVRAAGSVFSTSILPILAPMWSTLPASGSASAGLVIFARWPSFTKRMSVS